MDLVEIIVWHANEANRLISNNRYCKTEEARKGRRVLSDYHLDMVSHLEQYLTNEERKIMRKNGWPIADKE